MLVYKELIFKYNIYFSVCKQDACQTRNIRHLKTSLRFWICLFKACFKFNFLIKVILIERIKVHFTALIVSCIVRNNFLFLRFRAKASWKNLKNISIIRTFFEKAFRTSFIFLRYVVIGFIFGTSWKNFPCPIAPSHSHLCFVSCLFDILSSFFSIKFPAHCSATEVNPSRVGGIQSVETKTFYLASHNFLYVYLL